MRRKQKFSLHQVLEKSCGRDTEDVGMQIVKQTHESSKERLVGRDHFAFRISAKGSKQLGNNPAHVHVRFTQTEESITPEK